MRFANAKFTNGILNGDNVTIYLCLRSYNSGYKTQSTYLIGNFENNILESGTIYHETTNGARFKFVFNSLLIPKIFENWDNKQVSLEKNMNTAFTYFRTFIFGIKNNNSNSTMNDIQCSLFSQNGMMMK